MKFIEAEAKLAEIANGKYHSVEYRKTMFGSGSIPEVKCTIYIHREEFYSGLTWEAAFRAREVALLKPLPFTTEGQPEE